MDDYDDSGCGCCPIVGGGGVSAGGTATALSQNQYEADGEILISGSALLTVNVVFEQQIDFGTLATFTQEIEFQWNTGLQPLRWYQVQGCCEFPTAAGSGLENEPVPGGCDVMGIETDHETCQGATGKQYLLQTIIGRNVREICLQIQQQRLNWRICSIKRWSRPADPRLVSPSDQCNKLSEVPFRDIPECLNLSLDSSGLTKCGFNSFIVEVSQFETGGVIKISGNAVSLNFGGPQPTTTTYPATIILPIPSIEGDGPIPPTPTIIQQFGYGYIFLGGDVLTEISWADTLLTKMGLSSAIDESGGLTSPEDDVLVMPPIQNDIIFINTSCGNCLNVPSLLYLHHNLYNDSNFVNFMKRNGFEMPNPLVLRYSKLTDVWSANVQFNGLGGENSVQNENFRIVFEFACTNELYGEDLNTSSWKFSMLAVQKNVDSGFDLDTRLIIIFPPEPTMCVRTQSFIFDFNFRFNTETQYVSNQLEIVPSSVLFNDKIPMFKSVFWYQNPDLIFRISQNPNLLTTERQDIRPIFPITLPVQS